MASYPSDQPFPIPGGKTISGLTSDIEEYFIDNTEGDIEAPQIHNMLKNLAYTIPLSGSTNFNISSLTNHDFLKYESGKWVNSYNYTYHSSGLRTEVYSIYEVYTTGQTYNTGQTFTKNEVINVTGLTYYYDTGLTYSKLEIDEFVSISGLTDTIINSPQSGITITGSTISGITFDSLFYSGGSWVNSQAFQASEIINLLEITKSQLPTISGETVVDYIRSQFEKDVHVNKSGMTWYPNSDADGDLYLHTDGESGMTWQPSIYWYGQYGDSIATTGVTHLQFTFSGTSDGAGNMLINLNLNGIGYEPVNIIKYSKDENITFGSNNIISSGYNGTWGVNYCTITGGLNNTIFGSDTGFINNKGSFIGGGEQNNISPTEAFNNPSYYNSIVGGYRNIISGGTSNTIHSCFIGGGRENIIMGDLYNSIVGGYQNYISNVRSIIGGGRNNTITAGHSSILGGRNNLIKSIDCFIGGGRNNSINDPSSNGSVITGGQSNIIDNDSDYSNISGGFSNLIDSSSYSSIGGGNGNEITSSDYSSILSGDLNLINSSNYSSVVGGQRLEIINNNHCTAIGKWNYSGRTNGENVLFVIGNGTGDTYRHDAMVVTSGDSSIYFNSQVHFNVPIDNFQATYIYGIYGDTDISAIPPPSINFGTSTTPSLTLYAGTPDSSSKGGTLYLYGGDKSGNYEGGDIKIISGEGADLNYNGDIWISTIAGSAISGDVLIKQGDGKLLIEGTLEASAYNVASVQISGGVGIAKNLYVDGTIYGTVSPFTGCHSFINIKDNDISVGDCIYISDLMTNEISKTTITGQTNVVGLINSIEVVSLDTGQTDIIRLEQWNSGITGYTIKEILVAAVGDNKTKLLNGFKVCNENGSIKEGTLLISSSTPGYLMAQSDDIIRSMTVGKSMQNVTFDGNGEATGIYGFIYSG